MSARLRKHGCLLFAALSLLLVAKARADQPGYEFMNFEERLAVVVHEAGKMPKAIISEASAKELTANAQPLDSRNILLVYQGKVYIVPDRRMATGVMASDMIKSAATRANK